MKNRWKVFACLLTFVSCFGLALLFAQKSFATNTTSDNWSWTDADPKLYSSTLFSDVSISCTTSVLMTDVVNQSEKKRVCLDSDGQTRFGGYHNGSGKSWVVGFGADRKMYPFSGVCNFWDSCLYLPSSDILIRKAFYNFPFGKNLSVYKNFSKRLTRITNVFGGVEAFSLNLENPDYQLADEYGGWIGVGAVGASNNGKWLVIELSSLGLGLLNLETLEMRQIEPKMYQYGYGMDPSVSLGVSDDGRHIASMGMNVNFQMIDNDGLCGEVLNAGALYGEHLLKNPCKKRSPSTAGYINRYFYSGRPRFSDDGGELNFFAYSSVGVMNEIVLRAAGYESKPMDYIALGDSYSSGEGELDDKYYLAGTNESFEKCHTSYRSYPFLLSEMMNISPSNMASVACSGAETKDVVGDSIEYTGQGDRLGKNGLNFSDQDIVIAKVAARINFKPGRAHQEDFIQKYHPKAITIGIGGNDAGFMEILKSCITPGTCDWAGDTSSKEQLAYQIQDLYPTLVNTYKKIHQDSPSTKVYAIGYPKIVDDNGDCDFADGTMLDQTERRMIVEGIAYLNQIIESAADSAGVMYIDIEDIYGDSALCGSEKPYSMNSIRLGDDIPDFFGVVGAESFHPKPVGHIYAANRIYTETFNLLTYNHCPDGRIVCPNDSTKAPEPSEYWIPDGNHNLAVLKKADFASDGSNQFEKQISMPDGTFAPESQLSMQVMSTPRDVGSFEVDGNGGLSVTVQLPDDLEAGYHTIHLYGKSFSGSDVEYYQVISIIPPSQDPPAQPIIDVIGGANSSGGKTKTDSAPIKSGSEKSLVATAIDIGSGSSGGEDDYYDVMAYVGAQSGDSDKAEVKGDSVAKDIMNSEKSSSGEGINDQINWSLLSIFPIIGVAVYLYLKSRGR